MKILAFSDLHTNEYALREIINQSNSADLTVCAGDVSQFGNGLQAIMQALKEVSGELLLVPGNNDPVRQTQEYCQEYGFTFIHGTIVKRGAYHFAGLGAGLPGINSPFELTENEMKKTLDKFKGVNNLVLVSHTPPYGPLGETRFNTNIGSKSVQEFIEDEQPILCLTGHCHETAGQEVMIGETRVVNVGKHGKEFNLNT